MTSGVALGKDVKDEYLKMKQKSTFKYMMFRLSDDKTEIIIDYDMCLKKEDNDDDDRTCWDQMVTKLVPEEPRYIVFDIHAVTKDSRVIDKLLFISWCDDSCPIKERMIHASSEDTIKKNLEGLHGTPLQAHDKDDLEYEDVLKIVITRD